MKINEISGLYVAENRQEDFNILIAAQDVEEAAEIAKEYFFDSHMAPEFEVHELHDINQNFDCDYLVTYCSEQ